MRYEVSVSVNAPAELVWDTIFSVHEWPQWTPTVKLVQLPAEGPLRVGSMVTVRQPGRRPAVWTVTEIRPGTSFSWTTGSSLLRMDAAHSVHQGPKGTIAELVFEVSGPLTWLAKLLGGKRIRDYVNTEAASLKSWCERSDRESVG